MTPPRDSTVRAAPRFGAAAAAVGVDALLAVVVALMFLAAWRRDFRVPVTFSYDALEYLMQTKGTIENGWWWVHPRLSAPGTFTELLYPSNTTVDQALVWMVSRFSGDAGLVINVTWTIMLVLSAVVASACLRLLGVARWTAAAAGLLFAFSPYALARNIDHLALSPYLVPIPCAAAALAAAGRLSRVPRGALFGLFGGCALLGVNYPYYAFFGCFVIGAAAAIAAADARDRSSAIRAAALLTIICVAAAVNLAPSIAAWHREGTPVIVPQKHAAEADEYGLKIRHLISPVLDHTVPPFRQWAALEKNAKFPLENENRNARLGLVAAVGFLTLLAGFFASSVVASAADPPLFLAAGRLALASVLLAGVGGFGSLFSLLVTPDIRAYNRIVAFLSFFTLFAVATIADRWLRGATSPARRRMRTAALAAALVAGLYDEAQAAWPLNADHPAIAREWRALDGFVRTLEQRLPQGAMVFELPVRTYQNEAARERMLPNDLLKPYVVSHHLRWSYPALANAIVRWQLQVSRLEPPALAAAVAREGFAAILIDRYAYADGGQMLLTGLGTASAPEAVLAQSERYVAVDLSHLSTGDVPSDRLARMAEASEPVTRGLPLCAGATQWAIDWIGSVSPPFDEPPVRVSAEFRITGWAVDAAAGTIAGDVDIDVEGTLFSAMYGLERTDVARHFGVPRYGPSGFVAVARHAPGATTVSLRVLDSARRCVYATPRIAVEVR